MRRLLIRPGAIGDCILSLPALEYLKADYTEVWISSPVVPLIQFADAVMPLSSTGLDSVGVGDLEIPPRLGARLRSFESIVSWYGTSRPEFRKAIEQIGARCEFQQALPSAEYCGHAIDFFAQQAGAPKGLSPQITVTANASRDTVVIHPFSGGRRKNWPLDCYWKLAASLATPVEWTAGPEEELAGAVRFDNLLELAQWMKGARLYIGNDSGITHLAAAIGMPVIALFGPTDPEVWAPRGEHVSVMRWEPIEALPLSAVQETAQAVLARLASASSEQQVCAPR